MESTEKKFFYQRSVDIWKEFCELHQGLYEITCDEYLALLSGEVEKLEDKLKEKEIIINLVSHCEQSRQDLINEINNKISQENQIHRAGELMSFMQDIDQELDLPILEKLNLLLIDMVEKIQAQNKKNQLFLNKAIFSINEIKASFQGTNKYKTYGADGLTTRSVGR